MVMADRYQKEDRVKRSFPGIYMELQKCLKQLALELDLPPKVTRNLGFKWIERELGGLNPTPEQRRKTIALATQMGAEYRDITAMEHCRCLDFILDRITEFLCPEEWAANEARRREGRQRKRQFGQSEVFGAIYSGDVEGLRELGIDNISQLGGRQLKHAIV
jgi:hypothetical protein